MDALRVGIPGFKTRRAQLAMVAMVAHALGNHRSESNPTPRGSHVGIIEAGTGTGKSFGALVPAIVMARSRGMQLVVSSSTVALQQQYIHKDVPVLARLLRQGFSVAIAKGRRRYVCPMKLDRAATRVRRAQADPAQRRVSAQTERARERVLELDAEFSEGRWAGDRDELHTEVDERAWAVVSTDAKGCLGPKCKHRAACPYVLARRRVADADLIVANHDLVLSSLWQPGGLSDPAKTFYVFDEAHSLGLKVIQHFAVRHPLKVSVRWIAEASRLAAEAVEVFGLGDRRIDAMAAARDDARKAIDELANRLAASRSLGDRRVRRLRGATLPAWLADLGSRVRDSARGIQDALVAIRESLDTMIESHDDAGEMVADLGDHAAHVDAIVDAWDLLLAEADPLRPPVARWIEYQCEGADAECVVCASPIVGGDELRALLWVRAAAAVLMSATLTACGSFDLFMRQTGLDRMEDVRALQVPSPFDYGGRAQLVVARMTCSPTNVDGHTREVIDKLPALIRSRGTLVLFTSSQQMRQVHAAMPQALKRLILLQGSVSKAQLLNAHRRAIDAGESSVLFGLQSLAEGVDLPGEYCTHVVIAKLPFSVPDDPVEEARKEWVDARGGSAFLDVTLPEASVRLQQQVGRLLRTVDDSGTVTVLDRRLATKRWGAKLLSGLPPFSVVVEDRACAAVRA